MSQNENQAKNDGLILGYPVKGNPSDDLSDIKFNESIKSFEMVQSVTQGLQHSGLVKNNATGLLKINTNVQKFDTEATILKSIDYDSDQENPTIITFNIPAVTGIDDSFLDDLATFVYYVNATGALLQKNSRYTTFDELKTLTLVGILLHGAGNIVQATDTPIISYGSTITEISELVFQGGQFLTGCDITPAGGLKLNITKGELIQYGRGFALNPTLPNNVKFPAQTPISTIIKVYPDPTGVIVPDFSNNDFDTTKWNKDGLGTLENTSNPKFYRTVIQVFGDTGSATFYYGTKEYNSLEEAMSDPEPTYAEHLDTRDGTQIFYAFFKGNEIELTTPANFVLLKRPFRMS